MLNNGKKLKMNRHVPNKNADFLKKSA